MTDHEADRLDDLANLEAESRALLEAQQLERVAWQAGLDATCDLQEARERSMGHFKVACHGCEDLTRRRWLTDGLCPDCAAELEA